MSDVKTKPEWPVTRARAWLLRKAAELVDCGDGMYASSLARWAIEESTFFPSERMFRALLCGHMEVLGFEAGIDRAVAEVYGEPNWGPDGAPTSARTHEYGHAPGCLPGPTPADEWGCVPGCPKLETTTLRPAEEIAREMVPAPVDLHNEGRGPWSSSICDDHEEVWVEARGDEDDAKLVADKARDILARLVERSRAEGAAAISVDAALVAALRAEEADDANPHAPGSDDPLAVRLYNHGVRAADLAQRGARHVAERLFVLAEKSHAETKQLRARVVELEAAVEEARAALGRLQEDRKDAATSLGVCGQRSLASVLLTDLHLSTAAHALARVGAEAQRTGGIYIASKSVHGARWRDLRAAGVPIISTWIDEADEGQTANWSDLWDRCIWEASTADVVVVYVEPGEVHKGSLVELGAALHAGVQVLWVGPEYSTAPRHRLVRRVETMDEAISIAVARCGERQAAMAGGQPR